MLPTRYNGKLIYLELEDFYSNNKFVNIDSILIRNGKFTFSGKIPRIGERANLFVKNSAGKRTYNNSLDTFLEQVVVDSGKNSITINKVDTTPSINKLKNIIIPNSKTNWLFAQYDSLQANYMQYAIYDKSNPGFSTLPREKEKQMQYDFLKIIQRNPDNYYSLIYLRFEIGLGRLTEEEILNSFQGLTTRLKDSPLGREVNETVRQRIYNKIAARVGQPVPKFSVKTFGGDTFKNKDLQGKPYLIVFSATWCGPCQKELPLLKSLYDKYHSKGLEAIYFNLDDNIELWGEHIRKNNLQWINVSERTKRGNSPISEMFNTYLIPNHFLIDRFGKIVYISSNLNRDLTLLETQLDNVIK